MKAQILINAINKVPAEKEIEAMVTCDGDIALYYATDDPAPDDIFIFKTFSILRSE